MHGKNSSEGPIFAQIDYVLVCQSLLLCANKSWIHTSSELYLQLTFVHPTLYTNKLCALNCLNEIKGKFCTLVTRTGPFSCSNTTWLSQPGPMYIFFNVYFLFYNKGWENKFCRVREDGITSSLLPRWDNDTATIKNSDRNNFSWQLRLKG